MQLVNQARRAIVNGALAAAAATATFANLPAQAAETPQYGGVLTAILHPEPPSLILALEQVAGTQMVGGKIFECLPTNSLDLKQLPNLANSWEVSYSRLTYTIHLQQGVTWQCMKQYLT